MIRYLLNRPAARTDGYDVAAGWLWGKPERRSELILHYDDEFRVDSLPSGEGTGAKSAC